jgi:hypothetical protein
MTDIHTALNRAFQLGQTYWQQADSDSYKQNAKSDVTWNVFRALVDETCAALAAPQPPLSDLPKKLRPDFMDGYDAGLADGKRCAERDAAAAPGLSPSEAVYGFAGWLTCRADPVTFGSTHDAALPAELVDAFCKSQGLEPPRQQWADGLKPYPETPAAPAEPEPFDIEELRRALCGIAHIAYIDGHSVIRRDSVLDLVDRRRHANR